MHTKDETIAFIGYLKAKNKIIIDSRRVYRRTFFNHYVKDVYEEAAPLEMIIRKSLSVGDAYRMIAHRFAKQNCLWKQYPGLAYIFSEDLADFMEVGEAEKPALLESLRLGHFSDCGLKKRLPEDLYPWCENGITLRSRDVIFDSFPTEYLLFLHENYGISNEGYTVSVHNAAAGAYNGYRWEAGSWKKLMKPEAFKEKTGKGRFFVGYNSTENEVSEDSLVSAGKLLCEKLGLKQVDFCDYATLQTLIVLKNGAPSPESEP